MTAFVSWVDYSSAERLRMRQAVALFDEKDTRDELGIGSIRDALADALFPGTSTVQTRLRYALFVPWLYARLERDAGITSANVENKARDAETALIRPLRENPDTLGIVGIQAGRNVQRLPSSVYWLALQRWGVLPQTWSTDDYHRRWDRLRSARVNQRRTDDQGVLPEPVVSWHPEIPAPPEDFPAVASFELRAEEADFLRGRIVQACRGSLLAHAASPHTLRPDLAAPTPWDAFHELPPELAATVVLGRGFAVLVQGAALVYNLALSRLDSTREELTAKLEGALAAWADTAASLGIARQSLDDLWIFCLPRANVSSGTRSFLEDWRSLVTTKGYAGATRADESFRLVEQRERRLKGSRSRFANPRALETWGGQSGTGLLTYRWGTAQRFLADLYLGLDRGQS